MNVNVLITCLGLLTYISAQAATNNDFFIPKEQFRVGVLLNNEKSCLGEDGKKLLSTTPKFPLQNNTLYWRHKDRPRQYNWFEGNPKNDCFSNLKAFNLKKNKLSSFEASTIRFYGTQRAKSYQDEADLYFDSEYLYSQRVSTLYYMKDGRFEKMEAEPLPGILKIESTLPNYSFVVDDFDYGNSKKIFPLSPGLFYGTFVAPGYLPYVDVSLILAGNETFLKPTWVELNKQQKVIETKITKEQIDAADSLEEVERIHDTFIQDLYLLPLEVFVDQFDSIYPKPKQFLSQYVEKELYNRYIELFNQTKKQAKNLWNDSKLVEVRASFTAIRSKLDSLEKLPLRYALIPDSSRIIFDVGDSNAKKIDTLQQSQNLNTSPVNKLKIEKELEFFFKGKNKRYDVVWRGVFPNFNSDTLVQLVNKKDVGLKVFLSLSENKPLWIQEEGLVKSRHHYRYVKIEIEYNGILIPGSGNFLLPSYILLNDEVQDWLHRKKQVTKPDTNVKDTTTQKVQEPILQVEEEDEEIEIEQYKNDRLVRDEVRGDYIKLDSATFIFKKMIVFLSPFSINATEITQGHFARIMAKASKKNKIEEHSTFDGDKKPVQNISWLEAQQFCELVGGSLPTEAQWEYAARAGSNQGFIWKEDQYPDPGTYAVYKENSYKKSKKDSLYGPQPVASKKPNKWGLYDMSGNVAEWTLDKYSLLPYKKGKSNPKGPRFGSTKVIKGGSWKDKAKRLDLKAQNDEDPRYWADNLGFRCAFPRTKK